MPDGRSVPMTDQFREEIIAKYASMAVRPLRCLALATKASGGLCSIHHMGCSGSSRGWSTHVPDRLIVFGG